MPCGYRDVRWYNPLGYGARWDGIVDDTAAIQACIDAAVAANASVFFPPGETMVKNTLLIPNVTGLRMCGMSIDCTNLKWGGADGIPMFDFDQTQDCFLTDLKITATTACQEFIRIQDTRTRGSLRSSRLRLRDLFLQCADLCDIGVNIRLGSGTDAKNDHHAFFHVQIQAYNDAAISIEGQAARNILMIDPILQGRTNGQYGITTTRVAGAGGSFFIYGGTIMENQKADIAIGDRSGPCTVDGTWFEQSGRFLQALDYRGETSSQVEKFPFTVKSVRWSGDTAYIPADGKIVDFRASGPLVMIGNQFGLNDPTFDMRFHVEPRFTRSGFIFTGNALSADNQAGHFSGIWPDDLSGSYLTFDTLTTDMSSLPPVGDNSLYIPHTPEDWQVLDIPVPRSWHVFQDHTQPAAWQASTAYTEVTSYVHNDNRRYQCITSGTSAGSGGPTGTTSSITDNTAVWRYIGEGTGVVHDLSRRGDRKNLFARSSATLQTTASGHVGFLGTVANVVDSQFGLDDNDGYFNPNNQSMAAWLRFRAPAATGADNYVYVMGSGSAAAGGGPLVKTTNAGLFRLTIDGNTQNGTLDFRSAGDVDILLVYNRTAASINLYHLSSAGAETINGTAVYAAAVGNIPNKGIGASANTVTALSMQPRAHAIWRGTSAEGLGAATLRALRGSPFA